MDTQSQNPDALLVSPIADIIGTTLAAARFVGQGKKDLNDSVPSTPVEPCAAPTVFNPEPIAEKLRIWWESGAGDKYVIEHEETDVHPGTSGTRQRWLNC